MAGTRLLVVSTFFVPFSAWVYICMSCGLKEDLLWSKILRTVEYQNRLPDLPAAITIPPILLLVSEENSRDIWSQGLAESKRFRVKYLSGAKALCARRGEGVGNMDIRGVVVCGANFSKKDEPEIVIYSENLALFYPTNSSKQVRQFRSVFDNTGRPGWSTHPSKVQAKLWIHQNVPKVDRLSAFDSFVQWMDNHARYDVSCFDGLEIVQVDPSTNIERSNIVVPELIREVSSFTDKDPPSITLYVPLSNKTLLVGESSVSMGQHVISLLHDTEQIGELMISAMDYLIENVCWGISKDLIVSGKNQGDVNQFMESMLHLHQKVHGQASFVMDEANRIRGVLSTTPNPSTNALALYQQVVEKITNIPSEMLPNLLAELLSAQALIAEIEDDGSLRILPDFPLDQYAAIFAPLLFPLLLPVAVTFVREIKRLRGRTKKP